jgi:hypothetical protein
MSLEEIAKLPVSSICADTAHLYLWCPNAILPDGLYIMQQRGYRKFPGLHLLEHCLCN